MANHVLIGFGDRIYQGITGFVTRWKTSDTARSITVVYVGDMLSKVLAVATTLLLIRGLPTSDYASYVAFIGVGSLVVALVGGGINFALVRFSAEYYSRTNQKPYLLNLFSVLFQIAVFALILVVVTIFPDQTANTILGSTKHASIIMAAMFWGLGSLLIETGRSMLQALERYRRYVFILWITNLGSLLIVSGLWFSGRLEFSSVARGLSILYILIGIWVVGNGFYGITQTNGRSWAAKFQADKGLVREFLLATSWLMGYAITLAAFSRTDILMLSRYAPRSELAIYGVALQYYSLGILLLGSIQAVLRTKFSKADMQDTDRQQDFLRKWLQISVWTGIPILAFMLFGKPLFVFLNGEEYEGAFLVLAILAVGLWLSFMFSPLANILIGRKDFKFLFGLSLVAFAFNLVANYVGIHMWGAVGAAFVLVLTHNVVLQGPIFLRIRS